MRKLIILVVLLLAIAAPLALALDLSGPAPSAAQPLVIAGPPTTQPAPAPLVQHHHAGGLLDTQPAVDPRCAKALAYLAAHAKPGTSLVCDPIGFYQGAAAVTRFSTNGQVTIVIYVPTCAVAYENEASNSWFDIAGLHGWIPYHYKDAHGRVWDPYGGCPR